MTNYNSHIPYKNIVPNIADLGGKTVLNMGGSLSEYIKTGNQYANDTFQKQDIKEGTLNPKAKKTGKVKKALVALFVGALAIGGGVLGFKKGVFSKLKSKLSNLKKENIQDILKFDKAKSESAEQKNKFSFESIKNAFSKDELNKNAAEKQSQKADKIIKRKKAKIQSKMDKKNVNSEKKHKNPELRMK